MDSAVSGVIMIMLLLITAFTVAHGLINVQEAALETWSDWESRMTERRRTDLRPVESQTLDSGARVEITLLNEGDVKLSDFDRWDVIVEYDTSEADHRIEYVSFQGFSDDWWWTVKGLYIDASESTGEVFEPNVFNPGEEIVLQVWLTPTVGLTTTNQAMIVTPNGISASSIFTR